MERALQLLALLFTQRFEKTPMNSGGIMLPLLAETGKKDEVSTVLSLLSLPLCGGSLKPEDLLEPF